MKYQIDKFNYNNLTKLIDLVKQNKIERIDLSLIEEVENLPNFSEIIPLIYQLLDQELFFQIKLENFPFCVLNPEANDHILIDKDYQGEKKSVCKKCFWNNRCPGFPKGYLNKYGDKEICALPDLPWEVMIEVTAKCNFNCKFCFNRIAFAKENRKIENFSIAYLKKIIDKLVEQGVKIVRFTGGEPMLRKDIFELMAYLKNKRVETRLNTNASLINQKNVKKFKGILDNVLIPIEGFSEKKEAQITSYRDSLKNKIKAIKLFKEIGVPKIRVGTVAIKENILDFEKIAKVVFKLPVDEWELYRPIPINKKQNLNSKLINLLADKIIKLRKEIDKPVFIANALPFCAIKDLNKLNYVSKGGLFDDGYTRLVIDPRNFVKPHYFIDKNIGDPLDILEAWKSDFEKKIHSLEYLPSECINCSFQHKCNGGSRQAAKVIFGDYKFLDPLASPEYIKK